MGQNIDNYIVEIKLKDNVSDRRFDVVRLNKPSIKEYKSFETTLLSDHYVYSKKAEDIIHFFIEYKNGIICPDRYNYYEPVNQVFNRDDIVKPVGMLAFPGGCLFLKKTKLMDAVIENKTFSFCWCDGVYQEPKASFPQYLTIITLFFPKKKNPDLNFIIQLMEDIRSFFGADNGKVYCQASGKIIAE